MRSLSIAAAASFLAFVAMPHAQPAVTAGSFARAEETIRAEMQKAGIPGAAVAVIAGEAVVWAKGFGEANVETHAPVTPDTLFQIGSATKSFTAAALLSADVQGAIALDRPVSTYVSGLAPCVGAPTLVQLLSHTGGLIDEPDEYGPQGEEGLGAYQRTWTSDYCMLPPGRAFSYTNSGFALAGLALQEADRKPFAEVMRARVLGPLGMTRTTFRPTEAMTWPLAVGHRKGKNGSLEVVRPLANDARLWPAGTLYSSANEMARFVVALMNDGKVDGKQALPAGVAAKMRAERAEIATTGQHYGQGLFLTGSITAGHGGTMTGYAAEFAIEDWAAADRQTFGGQKPFGAVVLTNADGVNPHPLLEAALKPLAPLVIADGGPPRDFVSSVDEQRRVVGTYSNPRRFTVEVVQQDGGLVLKRFGRDFPMRAVERPGRFVVDLPRGGSEVITFGLPASGPADHLQMNVWALARVAGR